MDLITRHFSVDRGGKTIDYPFTSYSIIFSRTKNPIHEKLFAFLKKVLIEGVESRPNSVTQLSTLLVETERRHSDLMKFAAASDYHDRGNQQHLCLQKFLLKNDPHTLAIELPVWDDATLGHIDILRLEGDKVVIADFKPLAHKETKAASQVLRYAVMLSNLTKIPLSSIEMCYFDEKNAYFVKI